MVWALLLALALLQMLLLRHTLQAEHAHRSAAALHELIHDWTPLAAEPAALQAAAQARWARGLDHYLQVVPPSGVVWLQFERRGRDAAVPAAFAELAAWSAPMTQAVLPGGLTVRVAADARPFERWLWTASVRSAAALLLVGVLVWPLAVLAWTACVHRWWRAVDQAWQRQSGLAAAPLPAGAVPQVDAPAVARHLAASLQGLRADLARQAAEVALLQQQAQTDSTTGVALRHHFVARLQQGLAHPRGPTLRALLIVRIAQLAELNQRVGHASADRLLASVAHVLLTYVDRVPGATAGRLNGADFALALPVAGLAEETAHSLRDALRALPTVRSSHAEVVVGGVDELPATDSGTALAEADAALARAEAAWCDGVAIDRHGALVADTAGATAWRAQIGAALAEDRCQLEEQAVVDRDGRPLHWACTLRLQLDPQGEHQPAARWWALARRTQQLAVAEQALLEHALRACAEDRQGRLVRLTATTFHEAGRLADVLAALHQHPEGARRLSIEIAEADRVADPLLLAQAVQAWQLAGARLGIVQASGSPTELSQWAGLGVRFVSLGSGLLRGVSRDPSLAAYAQGLLRLARSLGLVVLGDSSPSADDAGLLWQWGLDGAPGEAARTPGREAQGSDAVGEGTGVESGSHRAARPAASWAV